jgi:hypothetical protein
MLRAALRRETGKKPEIGDNRARASPHGRPRSAAMVFAEYTAKIYKR